MFFIAGSVSWIAVFLGNPGEKYNGTRHNAGFQAARSLEKEKGVRINRLRFRSLTANCTLGGEKTLVMMPQTYMNLSGEAVFHAARFYKTPPERIIVVSDDTSLNPGRLRVRKNGSAGGHNGLKSIIGSLGTDSFPRIKIGVGAPDNPDVDMADWVLAIPEEEDASLISVAASRAAEALEIYIKEGAQVAMNNYNNTPGGKR